MSEGEDPTEEKTDLEAGAEERRSMYPDEGYALVEIDMMRLPGDALTELAEYDSLEEISMPEATDLIDYVVYDSEGRAYTHEDL